MGLVEKKLLDRILATHRGRIAVETGTFQGESTRRLARLFERTHTIELDAARSRETEAAMSAEGFTNVTFHVGDSGDVLPTILAEGGALGGLRESVMFFLDAHWSGDSATKWAAEWEFMGYGVDTAHLGHAGDSAPAPEEQCPLLREVEAICKLYAGPAVLYIDDLRTFGPDGRGLRNASFPGEDWSHISLWQLRVACGARLVRWDEDHTTEQLIVELSAK